MADLDENESGGALRTKLEEALRAKAEVDAKLAGYEAKDVISAQGYKYVTPQDLTGVPSTELAAKAAELENTKLDQAKAILRVSLAGKVEADQLEATIAGLLGKSEVTEAQAAALRLSTVSNIQGLPETGVDVNSLYGPDLLRYAIANNL